MKLKLSTGGFTLVDPWVYKTVSKFNWYQHKSSGYAQTRMNQKDVWLHRLLLLYPTDCCVDHVNRDRLDNRIRNLRLCAKSQNTYNVGKSRNNTSGYTGIHFHKHNRRFVAYVGKQPRIHLGSFKTKEEALIIRNWAVTLRYGEFASIQKYEGEHK